ncbi:MAG: hypothetical protein R3F60_15595 [bacterium]
MLPLCSQAEAARWLPRIEPELITWRRLAFTHPDLVLAALGTALAGPRALRPWVWARRAPALAILARTHPDALLDIAEASLGEDPLPAPLAAVLGHLARAPGGADRVVAWLVHPARAGALRRGGVPPSLLPVLPRLPSALVDALAREVAENPNGLAVLLGALPPGRRAVVFQAAVPAPDAQRWPDALMEVLPHALRATEARRQLALKAIAEDADARLAMTAWLPIEEARPTLEAAARGSQAEDRAQALALLVRCTGRSRRGLDATLMTLRRLRNEQDPVRLAALGALAQIPMAALADAHVDDLDGLVTAVVEARDTSYGTRRALLDLARRCLLARATTPSRRSSGSACAPWSVWPPRRA